MVAFFAVMVVLGAAQQPLEVVLYLDRACGTVFQTTVGAAFCDLLGTAHNLVVCGNATGLPVSLTCSQVGCMGNCTTNDPATWPTNNVCIPAPNGGTGAGRFTCLASSAPSTATALASPTSTPSLGRVPSPSQGTDDDDGHATMFVIIAMALWSTWL